MSLWPKDQMVTIEVKNSDSQIWNVADVVMKIMAAISDDQDILLDTLYEGCCLTSLGLYDILDKICATTGYAPERISIKVHNLKEKHTRYKIICKVPMRWLNLVRQKMSGFVKHPPGEHTKHFGHFVGHGNRFRLIIGSYLWHNHREKTLQTYHCVPTNEYHREFVALEDILFYKHGYQHMAKAAEFLQHTPMSLDAIKRYPIKGEEATDILDAYNQIFVDIVPQSYYSGNVFHLDEKFWRAVATRTPFLIQGPQWFIEKIRELGFKTFSNWWDEGYSEDPVDYQVAQILENIDYISTWSTEKISNVYKEMESILEHNYKRFLTITEQDLLKICYNDK